jgi:hypothetical protein
MLDREHVYEPQRPFLRGRIRFATLIVFTAALAIAVPTGWWYQQHRQLSAGLDAIRARGEPVTPAELYAMLPVVPKDKDCFALYQADDRTWMKQYRPQLWTVAPFISDKALPALDEEWEDEAFAEQFLADARQDFDRWHRAAALGGAANFPIRAEEGYGGLLPWVQPMRGIVRCLILEAYVRARHHDFAAAADSLHDAVVIAQSLESHPLGVTQLVRMGGHRELLRHLKLLLPQADFDAKDLARLQADLEAIDFRPGLRLGLLGDRVIGIVSADDPSTMGYGGRVDGRRMTVIHHLTKQQLGIGLLESVKPMLELADKPWPQIIRETKEASYRQRLLAPSRSTLDFDLLPEFVGHLDQYVRQGARATAANQVGILALAIARYRLDHGGFPEQLADLEPDYAEKVPLDATSGEPFIYTLDGRGLLLRSNWHDVNSKLDAETGADDDLLFRWPVAGP